LNEIILATVIGDYKMNDGSGVPPTNSQGTLGSALLCNLLILSTFLTF